MLSASNEPFKNNHFRKAAISVTILLYLSFPSTTLQFLLYLEGLWKMAKPLLVDTIF